MMLWTMHLDTPITHYFMWNYSYIVVPQTPIMVKIYREHANGYGGW